MVNYIYTISIIVNNYTKNKDTQRQNTMEMGLEIQLDGEVILYDDVTAML